MQRMEPRSRSSPGVVAASIYMGVVGSALFIVLPILLGILATRLGYSDRQIGAVASGQMTGMLLASVIAAAGLKRWGWKRPAYLGAIALVACQALSGVERGLTEIVALQTAAGLFGGLLIAVSFAHLGGTDNPDRNFGLWIAAQIALGIVGSAVLPRLAASWDGAGAFLGLAVLAASILPCIGPVCRAAPSSGAGSLRPSRAVQGAGVLSLVAAFAFGFGIMTFWAFLGRVGHYKGITDPFVSLIISLSLIASLAGALGASVIANRFGRTTPLGLALGVMLVALLGVAFASSATGFAIAALVFSGFWNFAVPYQLAVTAAHDSSGALIVLYISAVKGGYAIAPIAVGSFLTGAGYGPVYWLSASGILAALIMYLVIPRLAVGAARHLEQT